MAGTGGEVAARLSPQALAGARPSCCPGGSRWPELAGASSRPPLSRHLQLVRLGLAWKWKDGASKKHTQYLVQDKNAATPSAASGGACSLSVVTRAGGRHPQLWTGRPCTGADLGKSV